MKTNENQKKHQKKLKILKEPMKSAPDALFVSAVLDACAPSG